MRIVELDCHLVGESVERPESLLAVEHLVSLLVAADDVLEGSRDEEVLLRQTELLAHEEIVVRVQHAADALGPRPRLDGADVVARVELLEVELLHRPRAPEPQRVHRPRTVAGNRRVVRGGQDILRVDPVLGEPSPVVEVRVDSAVELDPEAIALARDLPRIAVPEPTIRDLDLLAGDDPLVEDAVVVAEAVAVGRVAESGQGIHEAGRQPTQAAVPEARVPLGLAEILETVAELAESLTHLVVQAQVDQAVAQRPTHQVLERQVVHALDVLVVVGVLRPDPALHHPITNRQRQRDVRLPLAVHMAGQLGERVLEVPEYPLLHRRDVHAKAVVGQRLAEASRWRSGRPG